MMAHRNIELEEGERAKTKAKQKDRAAA